MITHINNIPVLEGTSDVREFTGWARDLRFTADGADVVAMAGVIGLRMLADRSGAGHRFVAGAGQARV